MSLLVGAVQRVNLLKTVVGCHCYSVSWCSPECDVIKKSMHSLCLGVIDSGCSLESKFINY